MPLPSSFRALYLSQDNEGKPHLDDRHLGFDDLMAGDVVVQVEHSTLNYKDALTLTHAAPVVRHWPMVPGIDLAGRVVESRSSRFAPGDRVFMTGNGLGETHFGGFAEYARLPAEKLLPLPDGLDGAHAMAIGTAGLTAMLCVLALERHGLAPTTDGKPTPVVVSGATGGVGSIAVALLAQQGYAVTALSGKADATGFLESLGARIVMPRVEWEAAPRPLASPHWMAGIDVAGSTILANMLSMIADNGAVAACGMAAGMALPLTVAPFILRGIALLGVNSVHIDRALRLEAWGRLMQDLDFTLLDRITRTVTLEDLPLEAVRMLEGKTRGRVVVTLRAP